MEEPGSIDYVAEGEAMRIYGFIGCALYVLAFCPILYSLYKRKQSIAAFLLSMLLGGRHLWSVSICTPLTPI